jgi:hypothetical protein
MHEDKLLRVMPTNYSPPVHNPRQELILAINRW